MSDSAGCHCAHTCFNHFHCTNCEVLVGVDGFHVSDVAERSQQFVVTIESTPRPMGRPACRVVASSHGRRVHTLIDTPCFGRPVTLRWRKRTWSCLDVDCPTKTFTEQDHTVALPRTLL